MWNWNSCQIQPHVFLNLFDFLHWNTKGGVFHNVHAAAYNKMRVHVYFTHDYIHIFIYLLRVYFSLNVFQMISFCILQKQSCRTGTKWGRLNDDSFWFSLNTALSETWWWRAEQSSFGASLAPGYTGGWRNVWKTPARKTNMHLRHISSNIDIEIIILLCDKVTVVLHIHYIYYYRIY